MAVLKTYSIATDITGASLNVAKLHSELVVAGDIVNFDGISVNGDAFDVLGDSFTVANVDATVLAHVAGTDATGWKVPEIHIQDFLLNGVSTFLASGVGFLYTFSPNQTDEMMINIALTNEDGTPYDGSEFQLETHWMLFATPSVGDTVLGELDYAFVTDGEDNYTKNDGTVLMNVDAGARTQRQQYSDAFPVISGPAGAKMLQLTLRRTGVTDTYSGDVDFYGVNFKQ